ncbi:MAG: WbqC family protein [Bacteroidia bacterium]|nr:WbqC family protein [Bacteroidia bacterium]MCZ2248965.1 WbqC family protein [Bacteroidia bacterium]
MNGVFISAYAAPVSYYAALLKCPKIFIDIYEHFIKQTIRNRCVIAAANGKLVLTIPLVHRRNNMPTHEVSISYGNNWQRHHLKSLESAYRSSPFFDYYYDDLVEIYKQQPEKLFQWNNILNEQFIQWIGINTEKYYTTTYQKVYEGMNDYRGLNFEFYHKLPYNQVFEDRFGFISDLSIYDLLFNCGNDSILYLMNK